MIDFVVSNLNLTDYTKGEFTNIWMLGAKADSNYELCDHSIGQRTV